MSTAASKKKKKDDAMDLALLLFDMYEEQKRNGKIVRGQNYAYKPKRNYTY